MSEAPSAGKGVTEVQEPSRAERSTARRAAESRATIPHLELSTDVEMSACMALQAGQPAVSVTALLVRAAALALRAVPRANGAYRDGRFELYSRINIAVALDHLAPTVLDADTKSLGELSDELDALAERARGGRLTPPELAHGTFTLSDMSRAGIDRVTPVIVVGQSAALAAGALRRAAVVRNGAIVPGHMMTITLVCDQRIVDSARAIALLSRIKHSLQEASL